MTTNATETTTSTTTKADWLSTLTSTLSSTTSTDASSESTTDLSTQSNSSLESASTTHNSLTIAIVDNSLTPTLCLTIVLLVTAIVVAGLFMLYKAFILIRTRRRDAKVAPSVIKPKTSDHKKQEQVEPGGKYNTEEQNATTEEISLPRRDTIKVEVMSKFRKFRTKPITANDVQKIQAHLELLERMPHVTL